MPWVLDLRITHERWGSSSDPTLNGHLYYPNDFNKSLNEVVDKLKNTVPTGIITTLILFLLCHIFRALLGGYIVNLYEFCCDKIIWKLTVFLQIQESSFHNMIVEPSTTTAQRSCVNLRPKRAVFQISVSF